MRLYISDEELHHPARHDLHRGRGEGELPADRAPPRDARTGIGQDGKKVVYVPGRGVVVLSPEPPSPVPMGEPRYP